MAERDDRSHVSVLARPVAAIRGSRLSAWLPFVAVVATALVLSFPPEQHPGQLVKLFPDSQTYLHWTNGRPPTPWLFYAVVDNGPGICLVQTALSVLCWTALGWTALGVAGAVFGAALAASLPVALWNFTVLSEPLSLSFGAALCAATLSLGRQWTWPRFAVWGACVLLFTGTRVENFVIVPILCTALLAWHRARWIPHGVVAIAAAVLFLIFGVALDKESHNWQARMSDVVLTRILQDPQLEAEFVALGLPLEPSLLTYRGRLLAYLDEEFRAGTPEFQRWLDEDSRGAYLRWLATATPHRKLVATMDIIMGRSIYDYYTAGVRLPGTANDLVRVYDTATLPFRLWVWLAAVPILSAALSRRARFIDLFALAYLAAVYVLAFAVYHGDTGEVDRHIALGAALYRMAPIVVLGSVWDRLTARAA